MAFDGDADDDAEGYLRQRQAHSAISGSYRVASTDSGVITLVPAVAKHTHFLQRVHTDVTTVSASELWGLQDGAGTALVGNVSAATVAHGDTDFGAQGVPCLEGTALRLSISGATGAVGTIEWEGYKKCTGVGPQSYASVVLADSPSYYWRLNDPSGTTATEIIGGVNGTISGGVTLNQPGALVDGDKAMTFNGTTGKIVTAANVTVPQTVTVEAWVNTADVVGFRSIFSNRSLATTNPILFGVSAGLIPTSYSDDATPAAATGLAAISAGVWHHLVFVHSDVSCTFYVDGAFTKTTTQTRAAASSAGGGGLGADPNNVNFWSGSLDEVAIYAYALTPAQIRSHYEARTYPYRPGSYPAKVVQDGASNYWRLDEPSGTSAVDVIGGATGTISGGVTLNQAGALSDGDKAMTFNGTTGQIVTAASVTLPSVLTFELWVKTTTVAAFSSFVNTRTPGAAGSIWIGLQVGAVSLAVDSVATWLGAGASINNGLWHHLVIVLNGTNALSYVDGALNWTTPFVAGTLAVKQIGMGADNATTTPSTWFNGSLDDVAIYPLALPPAQIQAHYLLGIGQPR